MRTEDIMKVNEAGFAVIRPHDEPKPCIMQWSRFKNKWVTLLNKFKDKDDRDKTLQELLKNEKIILD